jgi:hypothetical protein
MPSLQAIGISSKDILFQEQRVAPTQKKQRFDALQEQGYRLLGKHLSRDVFLFQFENNFVIAPITDENETPAAMGVAVDDVESVLEKLWQAEADVFDAGAVGSLLLHLPAFRDEQGRIIVL